MPHVNTITRNIALLYDLVQLDIPVERVTSNLYRFTLNGAVWDYNPKRNTIKRVGTAKDIKAEPNVREWVKGKMKEK